MPAPDPSPTTGVMATLWRLTARHRTVVACGAVLGMLAGAVYGLVAPSTYTAESMMLVGTFEAPAAAIPGYVLASQTVAGNYARLATTNDVVEPFAASLGLSPEEARARVTVTAVPESAVIRITASGSDADQARATAEAMNTALKTFVDTTLNAPGASDQLIEAYQNAQLELAPLANTRTQTSLALADAQGAAAQAAAQTAYDNAVRSAAPAQLVVDGLAAQYRVDSETVSTSSSIRSLGAANVSKDSKALDTLLYTLIGLVVGGGLGLLVAWGLDRSQHEDPVELEAAPA